MRDLLSGFVGGIGLVVVDVGPEERVFDALELIVFNGDFFGVIPFVKLSDETKSREALTERALSRECVFERFKGNIGTRGGEVSKP